MANFRIILNDVSSGVWKEVVFCFSVGSEAHHSNSTVTCLGRYPVHQGLLFCRFIFWREGTVLRRSYQWPTLIWHRRVGWRNALCRYRTKQVCIFMLTFIGGILALFIYMYANAVCSYSYSKRAPFNNDSLEFNRWSTLHLQTEIIQFASCSQSSWNCFLTETSRSHDCPLFLTKESWKTHGFKNERKCIRQTNNVF
jgi:hypothetical protein